MGPVSLWSPRIRGADFIFLGFRGEYRFGTLWCSKMWQCVKMTILSRNSSGSMDLDAKQVTDFIFSGFSCENPFGTLWCSKMWQSVKMTILCGNKMPATLGEQRAAGAAVVYHVSISNWFNRTSQKVETTNIELHATCTWPHVVAPTYAQFQEQKMECKMQWCIAAIIGTLRRQRKVQLGSLRGSQTTKPGTLDSMCAVCNSFEERCLFTILYNMCRYRLCISTFKFHASIRTVLNWEWYLFFVYSCCS